MGQAARLVAGAMSSGASYGARIRLPHALVMTLLFQKGQSFEQKLRRIVQVSGPRLPARMVIDIGK